MEGAARAWSRQLLQFGMKALPDGRIGRLNNQARSKTCALVKALYRHAAWLRLVSSDDILQRS